MLDRWGVEIQVGDLRWIRAKKFFGIKHPGVVLEVYEHLGLVTLYQFSSTPRGASLCLPAFSKRSIVKDSFLNKRIRVSIDRLGPVMDNVSEDDYYWYEG